MSIRFVYGQDGLRRERIEEGGRVNYLLDGLVVLCEFDESGEVLREYVGGVSVYLGSESFYYHYDRLGSVRFMTDENGSVVCDYVYDAFGNLLSSSGSLNQPYEYVGREGYYREEFGLYLLGVRWYDSEAGRFISRDPIGEKGGINLYAYVRNNPIMLIDPEGEKVICWGVDLNVSYIKKVGVLTGISMYWCYDTCKKCWWEVSLSYVCSCIGYGVGVSASFEYCEGELLKNIISGSYNLISVSGISASPYCGSISWSDNFNCFSIGVGFGTPSGYICKCKITYSNVNTCCGKQK